jgi:hypothetical protein
MAPEMLRGSGAIELRENSNGAHSEVEARIRSLNLVACRKG